MRDCQQPRLMACKPAVPRAAAEACFWRYDNRLWIVPGWPRGRDSRSVGGIPVLTVRTAAYRCCVVHQLQCAVVLCPSYAHKLFSTVLKGASCFCSGSTLQLKTLLFESFFSTTARNKSIIVQCLRHVVQRLQCAVVLCSRYIDVVQHCVVLRTALVLLDSFFTQGQLCWGALDKCT